MRKTILKKTSGLLAMLLAVSLLVPLLAFASGFKNLDYSSNGTVTGQVYFDESVGDAVYLNITAPGGYTTTTTATYSTYNDIGYVYQIQSVNVANSVYDPITVTAATYPSVTQTVYKDPASSTTCFTCMGYIPTTNGGTVGPDGTISASTLSNLLQSNPDTTLTLQGDIALLPASALTSGNSVTLVTDQASYTLPLSDLHLADLAASLGVDLSTLTIKVSLSPVSGTTATAIAGAAAKIGGKTIGTAIDFQVAAQDQSGKVLKTFTTFDSYVTRTINLDQNIDPSVATGVVYDPATGEFSFVPSTFVGNLGKTVATIQRHTNSIYTVVQLNRNFNDITNSWAKNSIQLLANKAVIAGQSATTFAPDADITRAEFATLIATALGLPANASAAAKFSDVPAGFWGAGSIGAAVQAGIIYGDGSGKFRPNDQVTRAEMASMLDEALKYTGQSKTLTSAEQASALSQFKDAASLTWSSADVAALVNANIAFGYPDKTYRPANTTTRAEAAEIVSNFLKSVGFIN